MYQRGKNKYQVNVIKKFNDLQQFVFISSIFPLFIIFFNQKRLLEWHVLLVCAESPKCSSRTWSVNVLMNARFGFMLARQQA